MIIDTTLREILRADDRPLLGLWLCAGSAVVAEICAGSGADWLLIDSEHSPNSLASIQLQLQVLRGLPPLVMVRAPSLDPVTVKQYLDVGVQNLLIPMVNNADAARQAVAATQYPPGGVRGVGAALSRVSQWGRIPDYLARARESISLVVQIESGEAVRNVEAILAVDGIDGIFVGPSDLAASLGALGQQADTGVVAAVDRCIDAAKAAGKPCGVNAFAPALARRYLARGARFVLVGADVTVLASGSTALLEGTAASW
jgi:4-hydroxy-2-oxoheptanedioate aldolase